MTLRVWYFNSRVLSLSILSIIYYSFLFQNIVMEASDDSSKTVTSLCQLDSGNINHNPLVSNKIL